MAEEISKNQSRKTARCYDCKIEFEIQRNDVAFWPDHLWIGAVSAMTRCECGKWASLGWAHELPSDWQGDIPRRDWLQYCLPRIIYGCHSYGVPADLLPEFSEIRFFGESANPVPGQSYVFEVREGYRTKRNPISLLKTLISAATTWANSRRANVTAHL